MDWWVGGLVDSGLSGLVDWLVGGDYLVSNTLDALERSADLYRYISSAAAYRHRAYIENEIENA